MIFWKTFNRWWWNAVPVKLRGPVTWVGHGLMGFALGFALGQYGAGIAAGMYGYKEFTESEYLTAIKLDNVMDFVCPVVGGLVGMWIRWLM